MSKIPYAGLVILAILSGCNPIGNLSQVESTQNQAAQNLNITLQNQGGSSRYLLPHETQLSKIPQDPANPLTPEKVELGKLLFHETGLSTLSKNEHSGSWSCATCHFAKAGFQDKRVQSVADGATGDGAFRQVIANLKFEQLDAPFLKSPSILNVAYQENLLWNGMAGGMQDNLNHQLRWDKTKPHGFNHLKVGGAETQAIIALGAHRQTHDNMNYESVHEELDLLNAYPEYTQLFEKAYPNEPINRKTIGLAIAAYERTVLPTEAPFQRFLRGEKNALNMQELQGAELFFGKANCSSCHTGPALSTPKFYALGFKDMQAEFGDGPDEATRKGRGGFTGRAEDEYKFKVPQLYNIKDAGSLGHGGSFQSSTDMSATEKLIRYKLKGQPENPEVPLSQLAPEFTQMGRLTFSESDIKALTAFVENGLYDPHLKRFEPAKLPSGKRLINDDF